MRLPSYPEAEKRVESDVEPKSLLDIFVYRYTPDDFTDHISFRWDLQCLLDYVESQSAEFACATCQKVSMFHHYMFKE